MSNKRAAICLAVIAAGYFVLYLWTAILMDEWRALYFKCAGYHYRCVTESAMVAETIKRSEWDAIKSKADIVLQGKVTLGPVRWYGPAWAHIIMRAAGASLDGRYWWQVDDSHWIVLGPIGVKP